MSNVSFSAYAALGSVQPTKTPEKPAQAEEGKSSGLAEGFSTFKAALQDAEQAAMQATLDKLHTQEAYQAKLSKVCKT